MPTFRLVRSTILAGMLLALLTLPLVSPTEAQVFGGPGLAGGMTAAGTISGPVNTDIRSVIVQIVEAVLDFVALIAVVVIIIDGVRLVVSMGRDEEATAVRKSIIHVIIGLILIIASRIIVSFIASILN